MHAYVSPPGQVNTGSDRRRLGVSRQKQGDRILKNPRQASPRVCLDVSCELLLMLGRSWESWLTGSRLTDPVQSSLSRPLSPLSLVGGVARRLGWVSSRETWRLVARRQNIGIEVVSRLRRLTLEDSGVGGAEGGRAIINLKHRNEQRCFMIIVAEVEGRGLPTEKSATS
ncbi:hypothetical protein FA13DRAFT_1110912 [Coprinellus micaceus]|uniref:Uncharacterized protein n=1 Tax=Coprinellus micaceus TaxID=71717 RepID=A0A4Y7SW30_COPMI|nr:hypothetical protein FA13DRAFT_1110912 [Coprinellus micaceus]